MSSLLSYLPDTPGLLPKWLLFVSAVSILNTAQAYLTLQYTRRIYPYNPKSKSSNDKPSELVTPLSSRTFGTWTFISGIVRFYGAYRLEDPDIYQLVMWTYGIALAHFGSEAFVYGTTGPKTAAVSTFLVATGSLVWMGSMYGEYVK